MQGTSKIYYRKYKISMKPKTKTYWANYYGINPNLPDGEFWNQINKINHLALQKIENYNKPNHSKTNTINHY